MKREEIIRMALEADPFGLSGRLYEMAALTPETLERFAALAVAAERKARQAAQIENEELKARIAHAGVEQRRAVWEEREACAKVLDQELSQWIDKTDDGAVAVKSCADVIRARGTA